MADKIYPSKGDTVIGHDVWLGYRASILPGVTIGNGSIIGAYSVVMCDVPPYSIVGGNPAQLLRPRFNEQTIEQLQTVAWWDWPVERITQYASLLTGEPAAFLAAVQRDELATTSGLSS